MRDETRAFLVQHRVARIPPLADLLVETIEADNPGYRAAGVVPREDLRRSCVDNIDRILELLADPAQRRAPRQVERDPAFDAARDTGRRRAEQGLPLDDVLRSFRIGGRLIWDDLVAAAPESLDPGELRDIGSHLWEVVDQTSAQVAAAYHRHERAAVRAAEQQRAELWEGLLSGRAREPAFVHLAARTLDLPVNGGYLVVIGAEVDLGRAEQAVSPLASRWVRRTAGAVGLVALRGSPPDAALRGLDRLAQDAGRPLGVSSVLVGLAAVGDALGQAQLALRAQGDEPGLAAFDRRLPEALLLSSISVSERLVEVWLGPVLALGASEGGVLVDTLRAWVECGGAVTPAAERVPCHRNTVVNRLRRVGDLVGHDLLEGAPPVELDLALRAHRLRPRG